MRSMNLLCVWACVRACVDTVFVLLMERIYELRSWDGLRWHVIHTKNLRGFDVGITDGSVYEVSCWDDLKWHDMHTIFYDHLFMNSRTIGIIASTVWEAAVLVLLERIYEGHHCSDGLREHDTCNKFCKDRFWCSKIVRGEDDRHMCADMQCLNWSSWNLAWKLCHIKPF